MDGKVDEALGGDEMGDWKSLFSYGTDSYD